MEKGLNEEAVRQRVRHYCGKADTWARESRLCRDLRNLPEEGRFRILKELHADDYPKALILVYWCIDSPAYCEAFLRDGLLTADSTGVKWYVRHLAPKLGWPGFFRVLQEMLAVYPEGVRRAIYWVHPDSFGERLSDEEWQQVVRVARTIQSDERYIAELERFFPPALPEAWKGTTIQWEPGTTPIHYNNRHVRFGEVRAIQYRRVIREKTNRPRPETSGM